MSFFINWQTKNITSLPPPRRPLQRAKRFRISNLEHKTTKYICFVDLEPNTFIQHYSNCVDLIPRIRKIAFMFCSYADYVNNAIPYDKIKFIEFSFTKTTFNILYLQIINNLLEEPIFVAHNGYNFDFRILLAQYFHATGEILQMKLLDSLYLYQQKESGHSMANSALFIRYLNHYPDKILYSFKAHNPEFDIKMTSLWLRAINMQLLYIDSSQLIQKLMM